MSRFRCDVPLGTVGGTVGARVTVELAGLAWLTLMDAVWAGAAAVAGRTAGAGETRLTFSVVLASAISAGVSLDASASRL